MATIPRDTVAGIISVNTVAFESILSLSTSNGKEKVHFGPLVHQKLVLPRTTWKMANLEPELFSGCLQDGARAVERSAGRESIRKGMEGTKPTSEKISAL